ncbi:MAG: hypothetical protein Q9162_003960 [Coniocarpon cinnabarinum]
MSWKKIGVAAVAGCLAKWYQRSQSHSLVEEPLNIPAFAQLPLSYFSKPFAPETIIRESSQSSQSDQPSIHNTNVDFNWSSGLTWSTIEPSTELIFHPCYDDHECARLKVPMDWHDPSLKTSEDTVALAVIRVPAKVPVTDPRHGGAVVIQTGGPGGSGVDFLRKGGREHQTLIDAAFDPDSPEGKDENARFFDLLAFDPRGIKRSTPFHTCFRDPHVRLEWDTHAADLVPGAPEFNFAVELARQRAVYESCHDDGSDGVYMSKISSHMGAASVARDHLELVERYGQWREGEARRLGVKEDDAVFDRVKWRKDKEVLRYWGISYGTVIGATFASMYPERVERMVLDAVVNTVDDYWQGKWEHSVNDADELINRLLEYCAQVPSSECAMNTGNDTAATIQQRFASIETRLLHDGPISVPVGPNNTVDVITWSDFRNALWAASYDPATKWRKLMEILAPLAQGNGTAFAIYKQSAALSLKHLDRCPVIDPYNPDCAHDNYFWRPVWSAVQCGDADNDEITAPSRQIFSRYYDFVTNQSTYLGAPWSWLRFVCLGWKGESKFKPSLPVGSDTLNPILFVGNTLDNVTPLINARTMAKRFPGSRILQLDAEGHGLLSGPSLCAAKTVRAYFQEGTLPETGKRCLPMERPLVGSRAENVEVLGELRSEEERLVEAVKGLKKVTKD